jgi:hypothetical protein
MVAELSIDGEPVRSSGHRSSLTFARRSDRLREPFTRVNPIARRVVALGLALSVLGTSFTGESPG